MRKQPAELVSLSLVGLMILALGGAMLFVGVIFSMLYLLPLAAIFGALGLFFLFARIAKLGRGHWHEVLRVDNRFLRYVGRDDGGSVLIYPWEKIETDPFWVDHSLDLDLKSVGDLMTHDDMPFDLKGTLILRFDPRLVARDIQPSLPNHLDVDEELLSHAKVQIAHTVNEALIALGQRVTTAREFEIELRDQVFRNQLSQAIIDQFTPLHPGNQVTAARRTELDMRIADIYGLVPETFYIRGQFGSAINRLRERLTGGAQGARLAQTLERTEDISLEDIAVASGATQSYMKLRGFVSTDRRKRPAQQAQRPAQNDQQAPVQAAPPLPPVGCTQPTYAAPPRVEQAPVSPPDEVRLEQAISRLSSNPADILREQRAIRNQAKDSSRKHS